jgi:hypothetical protein
MKGIFSYATAAFICGMVFSSCVPYDQYGRRIQPNRPSDRDLAQSDPKLREIEAKREELRKKEEQRKRELGLIDDNIKKPDRTKPDNADRETVSPPLPKPPDDKPKTHPVAAAVPGKPGFVFSPFNNKVVDVREVGSGKLVADPNYPLDEKKYFRVP